VTASVRYYKHMVKLKIAFVVGLFLTLATFAFAQDRFELSGVYSYLHFDPTVAGTGALNFNAGGGGGIGLNFLALFGLKAEFIGYSSTTFTKTFPVPVIVPGGVIPAGTYTAQGNMYTALAGPVIRIPIPKVKPFGEALFGISGSNGYTNLNKSVVAVGGPSLNIRSEHPFTMAIGGGVDISVSNRVSIRPVEADYVLTLFNNPLTRTNQQNNFRYCGGIVLKF